MKVFSTPSVIFQVHQVNEDQGILSRVIVAQAGHVKSHFEIIDQTTLEQILKLGNAKEKGVKARFGHPNMCSSSFGTYIGRFKNFQLAGDSVVADLHLDPVCKDSPSGNLYNYIMSMAKNNPDMFGASIAFVPAQSEVKEDLEFPATRIGELLATDLVDDPAATNSLFAVDSFSYQATTFLDANPAIAWLIAKKPETIVEFMLKYFSNNDLMKKEMFQKLRNLFSGSNNETDENAKQEVLNLEKYFDDMAGRIGETYAMILENLRKIPVKVVKIEGFDNPPAGSESILEKILVKEELTVENMFDDVKTIVLSQLSQATEIITFYNSVIDKLRQDHQIQLSSIQDQVSSLQDQLKAKPTQVEGLDPQLQVAPTEETFGRQFLREMPQELKEKLTQSSRTQ